MTASIINFSNTTPAASSAGKINALWQNDGGSSTVNVSAEVPYPTRETVTFTGTAGTLANTPVLIIVAFKNGQEIELTTDFTIAGANITLVVAAVSTDKFIFVYYF
jgi:hypothetical protein